MTWRQGGFCKLPSAPIHSYMSGGCNAYTTLVVGITVVQGRAESDIWLHYVVILHLEALLVSSQHASSLKKGFSRFDPSAKGTSIPFFSYGLDKILSNPFRKRPMQCRQRFGKGGWLKLMIRFTLAQIITSLIQLWPLASRLVGCQLSKSCSAAMNL